MTDIGTTSSCTIRSDNGNKELKTEMKPNKSNNTILPTNTLVKERRKVIISNGSLSF